MFVYFSNACLDGHHVECLGYKGDRNPPPSVSGSSGRCVCPRHGSTEAGSKFVESIRQQDEKRRRENTAVDRPGTRVPR